ncbi:putative L-asparaginase II, partial [Mycobacterium sp. PO1]
MREAALLGQPVFGFVGEFGNGVPREELRRDHAGGGFLGDGLGAVLAELGQLSAPVLFGPRAARAVEAVPLVEFGQRRC